MSSPYRISWRRRWRRLRRHPLARLAVVVLVAAGSLAMMAASSRRAEEARRSWGETRPVAVAGQRLTAGEVVSEGDVTVESWPSGLVPPGALETVPIGRTVSSAIEEGEPLVEARLAPAGVSGLAALVPPGWRALAVPVAAGTLPLTVGDAVDLLATFPAGADAEGPPTFPVAEAALVLAVGEQEVTVAIPAADAARVAFAVSTGTVIPALRGP